MGGSYHYDKNSRRWFFQIYWEGKPYRVWRNPETGQPYFSKQSAIKQLSLARDQVDRGIFNPKFWRPDSPMLIRNYARDWLKDKAKHITKKTLTGYKTAIERYVIPFMGDIDLRYIRAKHIRQFKESLPLEAKGIYNTVSALRTLFRDAYRDEDILSVPPFPKLSKPKTQITYLTYEQQGKLLNAIPDCHKPIFIVGMEYGLRVGEVRAIPKSAITENHIEIMQRFSDNELLEGTKAGFGTTRRYELTKTTREALAIVAPHLGPFVFVRKDGKPYTNKNLNEIWHKAEKATGIHCKLYNAMRHSLGCQLLDLGYDMDTVRQILGHSNISMTQVYAERSGTTITQALEARHNVVEFNKKRAL